LQGNDYILATPTPKAHRPLAPAPITRNEKTALEKIFAKQKNSIKRYIKQHENSIKRTLQTQTHQLIMLFYYYFF
jgi:hypothetical protein